MAKSSENSSEESFDLERLRKLLQLMEKFDVTETSLQKNGESWKIRRGPKHVTVAPQAIAPQAITPAPAVAQAPAAAPAPVAAAAPEAKPAGITIDAPTVGTFYTSPTPDEPTFVNVGSVVQPDTVVCIIEAMKVFNQIPAEKTGKIVEVLVENGAAVDFGQPLYRIEPA